MRIKKTALLGTSVLLSLATPCALPSNSLQNSIHWIDQKIHQASLHLTDIKKNRDDLQTNLQTIEERISSLTQEQSTLRQKLTLIHAQNQALEKNILQTQQTLESDQKELSALLVMEYRLGTQSNLQLALNNQSIQTKQRLTHYLTIINKKESELAKAIENKIQDLSVQQNNLRASETNYQHTLIAIQQTKKNLETEAQNRLVIMKNMNTSIASHAAQLESLMKQKQALTSAIAQANQDIPVTEQFNFTYNFKENMHWPTQGTITQAFGKSIEHSQLTTDGLVISAPMGQPVYAIANGVVVFSKWLQGYGLLMIINQGHGYMSLYGRNQQLFFHSGQIIKKGDLIASVGNTGGFNEPGLYFAIRYQGVPVNPKNYL
jgi:septal ring factor EnvC (AmiA/AmiB activator)